MKIRPLLVSVFVLVFVTLATGCGTMSKRGEDRTFPFRSHPPGATVAVDGKRIGVTPVDHVGPIDWKKGFSYQVSLPGHYPVSGQVTSKVDWMVMGQDGAWLPFPLISGIAYITDWRTGAIYRLMPEFVHLNMMPLRPEDTVITPLRATEERDVRSAIEEFNKTRKSSFAPADPAAQPVKMKKKKVPLGEPGT
jgi:predicted small secreted protein